MGKHPWLARIEHLESRQSLIDTILQISRDLNTARTEEEILLALVAPAREAGASTATLAYTDLDESGKPTWIENVACWQKEGVPVAPPGSRFCLSDSSATQLWFSNPNTPVFSPHVATDERLDYKLKEMVCGMGVASCVWLALAQAGRWVALLTYGWRDLHSFGEREVAIYHALPTLAAAVVENRRIVSNLESIIDERTAALGAAMVAAEEARAQLHQRNQELEEALNTIQSLSGLIPLCAWCGRRIKDESGQWVRVESFVEAHSKAKFTHGLCPNCLETQSANAQQWFGQGQDGDKEHRP